MFCRLRFPPKNSAWIRNLKKPQEYRRFVSGARAAEHAKRPTWDRDACVRLRSFRATGYETPENLGKRKVSYPRERGERRLLGSRAGRNQAVSGSNQPEDAAAGAHRPGFALRSCRRLDTKPQETSGNGEVSYPRVPRKRRCPRFLVAHPPRGCHKHPPPRRGQFQIGQHNRDMGRAPVPTVPRARAQQLVQDRRTGLLDGRVVDVDRGQTPVVIFGERSSMRGLLSEMPWGRNPRLAPRWKCWAVSGTRTTAPGQRAAHVCLDAVSERPQLCTGHHAHRPMPVQPVTSSPIPGLRLRTCSSPSRRQQEKAKARDCQGS